jgi:hypothetical protein
MIKKLARLAIPATVIGVVYWNWPSSRHHLMARFEGGMATFSPAGDNLWRIHADLPAFKVDSAEIVDWGAARPVQALSQGSHLTGQVQGPIQGRILRMRGEGRVIESAVFLHE